MEARTQDAGGFRVAITGGTSGLGNALTIDLISRGARVAVIARDRERLEAMTRRWPGAHGIAGDVASRDAIHRMALQVTAALGGLDVLVNNASSLGPVPLRPLADTDSGELELALATNLLGPFRLTKALLGALAASARSGRGGLIVNVSSDAAVQAYPGWGAYGASKAALLHLTKIWDAELRPLGVRLLSFDPGDMDTPLHAAAVPDADRATLRPPADAARELAALILDGAGMPAAAATPEVVS